ncbi:stage II sporulation protein P [Lysinibacillus antri]|uniref:Stage II sporulation protein P n=1 Tax=Lysinibacillus antri TaxID=2498145 RepID=A0A3S0R4L4_9BACI|nr:stage II sporulation protein P [Lysinibacillus antri]RUL49020.1 stage II sporulation protein P [Lysinibacillus antri]
MKYKAQVFWGYILLLFVLPMIVANFTSKVNQEKTIVAEQYESKLEQMVVEPSNPEQNVVLEEDKDNFKQDIVAEQNKVNLEKDVATQQDKDNLKQDTVAEQDEINPEQDDTKQLEQPTVKQTEPSKALVLFTHSHEAFIPMVKSENGKTPVYHANSNIMEFEGVIKNHFELNSINTEFLGVDTMTEMKKTNRNFSEAYVVVRPYLVEQIKKSNYDIIIDLHRDSAKRDISTLNYNNETFGKLYFVVGEDNPNYSSNKVLADKISTKLNELVPGISRGVIGKKGNHVDGIYNQDLSKNMVLIELGGIENTQDEINRTISVLSKAVSTVIQEPPIENKVLSDTKTISN